MTNYRLRNAMTAAGVSQRALAEQAEVSAKSVERWITQDRMPHPSARAAVARRLQQDETYFWPALLGSDASVGAARSELVQVWPTRTSVPADVWHSLMHRTQRQLDVLVYAGGFLVETFRLVELLREKNDLGVRCRILIGDPNCQAVRDRAEEEALPGLVDRCRSTLEYLSEVTSLDNVQVRTHDTTLYVSHFRFDENLLVNTHSYGSWAARSPVQHIQFVPGGQLFNHYDKGFDRVWERGTVVA